MLTLRSVDRLRTLVVLVTSFLACETTETLAQSLPLRNLNDVRQIRARQVLDYIAN